MLAIHNQAISGASAEYHIFLSRYSEKSPVVYGFVEGKDDPSFYRCAIERFLPPDWKVELWPVGGKEKVCALFYMFNWAVFQQARVAFFIDRDLSEFIFEAKPDAPNLYITDNYSIENDIVNRNTCEVVLRDVCNLTGLTPEEMGGILSLFDEQLTIFKESIVWLMAWIINWRRTGCTPNLADINLSDLFTFNKAHILVKYNPDNLTCEEYIHKRCGLTLQVAPNIGAISTEFKDKGGLSKFIRGKYELWFMVAFILSIHQNISHFSSSITAPTKMYVNLGIKNALIIIGPRARIPSTLQAFFHTTYLKYIKKTLVHKRCWFFKQYS
jgi:hypothetical protein